MKARTWLIGGLLGACVAIAGCGTLKDVLGVDGEARLAVTYGTMKYIDGAQDTKARAAKVREVVVQVQELAHGDSVSVDSLKAYVIGKLPADLDPADRMLASLLVESLAAELQKRVGDGVLDPEKLLVVDRLLGWVLDATAYYG